MRGVYTGGVLDFFMDKGLYYPYVIGVSAGACNAASYLSRQVGRNRKVTVGFVRDPRYLSYRNLLREKSMFGMSFIFNEIPNKLVPFDFEAFDSSKERFVVGTTDCVSGEPVYMDRDSGCPMLSVIQASSSLPFVAQPLFMNGRVLMDGGISDPIPIRKSMEDGNGKNVIILTQDRAYRKKPFKLGWLAKRVYPEYQGLVEALVRRYEIYNETLEYIDRLEQDGRVFVIRPEIPLPVSRMEKNRDKLDAVYDWGYRDAEQAYGRLLDWMER